MSREIGFSGGASGFGDHEFMEVLREEGAVGGTGLSVGMLRSVARRQLVGSIVVAATIVIFAGLTALRPAQTDVAGTAVRSTATVQQPVLATPSNHRVAVVKHETELP